MNDGKREFLNQQSKITSSPSHDKKAKGGFESALKTNSTISSNFHATMPAVYLNTNTQFLPTMAMQKKSPKYKTKTGVKDK